LVILQLGHDGSKNFCDFSVLTTFLIFLFHKFNFIAIWPWHSLPGWRE
jgi:hypothetical protein